MYRQTGRLPFNRLTAAKLGNIADNAKSRTAGFTKDSQRIHKREEQRWKLIYLSPSVRCFRE